MTANERERVSCQHYVAFCERYLRLAVAEGDKDRRPVTDSVIATAARQLVKTWDYVAELSDDA